MGLIRRWGHIRGLTVDTCGTPDIIFIWFTCYRRGQEFQKDEISWNDGIMLTEKSFSYLGLSKRGEGDKRSRARAPKGPVSVLCRKILLLLYISAVHFYGNLSALKGHLQEPSILMAVSFYVRNQTHNIDIPDLSKLVLSQRVSRWRRRVVEFLFTFNLFGL